MWAFVILHTLSVLCIHMPVSKKKSDSDQHMAFLWFRVSSETVVSVLQLP